MSSSSQNPDRDAYIAGLRELAGWLEKHPDATVPIVGDVIVPLTSNEAVETYARTNELEVVYDSDGNASASVTFGKLVYRAYGYANWDVWTVQRDEQRAHDWADKNGMVIQPREGGAS